MLKILKSYGPNLVRLPQKRKSKLKIGMIAQTIEEDAIPKCTISDGTKPLGIVVNLKGPLAMVEICCGPAFVRTDRYDRTAESYILGAFLYVDKLGSLTSRSPYDGAIPVAKIITAPRSKKQYIDIHWI